MQYGPPSWPLLIRGDFRAFHILSTHTKSSKLFFTDSFFDIYFLALLQTKGMQPVLSRTCVGGS